MPSFQFSGESRNGTKPWPRQFEMNASATITIGDLLIPTTTGKLIKVAAQDARPEFVANETKTATATGGEEIEVVDIGRAAMIWRVGFTPTVNNLLGQADGTTLIGEVIAPATYNADDYKGGKLYCKEYNETRTITASEAKTSGNAMELTVSQPFSGTTVGKTLSATPLGLDVLAAKLIATNYNTISQVIADLTGGYAQIIRVDMVKRELYVVFN